MSAFDIKTYYAEQDERMNIPDETVDEFLKRVSSLRRGQEQSVHGSSRMSPVRNSIETDNPQPETASPTTSEAAQPGVLDGRSRGNIFKEGPTMDFGRSLKRKASVPDSVVETTATAKRQKSIDQDNCQERCVDHPPIDPAIELPTAATLAPISDEKLTSPAECSTETEDIDSFTVDISASQVPSKRKTTPGKVDQSPRKHKSARQSSAPQPSSAAVTADHSPISSFSRVITQSPKKSKISRREILVPALRHPPLNLLPLSEVPLARPSSKNKKGKGDIVQSDEHDSPIEDPSLIAASPAKPKTKRLEAEPSELFLEIKQRIAKHGTTSKKQGEKVVKVKAKPVLRGPIVTGAAERIDESSIIYISSSPSSRASSLGPTGASTSKQKVGAKEKVAKPPVKKPMPKGKKEKPQPVTPAEYARMLQADDNDTSNIAGSSTSMPVSTKRKKAKFPYLEGNNIFYAGGDMRHASETTRRRMEIIVRYGGNLMPEYDPNVTTHIIAEAHEQPLLRALGLRSLKKIPDHIPTVKWTWVLAAMDLRPNLSQGEVDAALGEPSLHAAFADRISAGCRPTKSGTSIRYKGKEKAKETPPSDGGPGRKVEPSPSNPPSEPEIDYQPGPSTPPGAPLSPPTSPIRLIGPSKARAPTNTTVADRPREAESSNADPLAEFYHQAKILRETEDRWKNPGTEPGSDEQESDDGGGLSDPCKPNPKAKRGWTCDKKEPQQLGECPNEDIIAKLNELMQLHKAKPGDEDHWRAFSYSKCTFAIRALRNYPRRIKSYEEARCIRGVGERTAKKIEEILQTGELQRIKYEKSEDVMVTRLFQGIYGVGQSIAFQWYAAGCRTLEDLKSGKGGVKLTPVQEIGLNFYDDINDRMPRAEAKAIFDLIELIALSIDPKLSIEIMGSYRRGKPDCGDIDILMTRPTDDGNTHSGVLPRLLKQLHDAGILTEDLAIPDDLHGLEATYRGLCRLPHVPSSRRRRIDILCVPWSCRGAARLYYTGDDIFNRAIRMKANVLGYSLNQRGLFSNVIRNPSDRRVKLNPGVLVASETEEEIFKILGVPWQEPGERVRG